VRDEIADYEACGVRPFGVNPASTADHAGYASRLGLPFPLLSDPGLTICMAYGAVRPDGASIARSVCLVDRDGTILYSQRGAPGANVILDGLRCP
jgi:thioredoxin-dependent peroxiredoxin